MGRCEKCAAAGLKSRPQVVEEWDVDGLPPKRINEEEGYHLHSMKMQMVAYQCTNGHEWVEGTIKGCRMCETLDETQIIE